jgi:hypothetical protein
MCLSEMPYNFNGLHCGISQKTAIFMICAVRTQFLLHGHSDTWGINKYLIHIASTRNQSAAHSLARDRVWRGEFGYTCEPSCAVLHPLGTVRTKSNLCLNMSLCVLFKFSHFSRTEFPPLMKLGTHFVLQLATDLVTCLGTAWSNSGECSVRNSVTAQAVLAVFLTSSKKMMSWW